RVKAVTHFRTLEDAEALAAANKRVSNILSKSNEKLADKVLASVLKAPQEVKLATHLVVLQEKLEPMFAERNYQDALVELASLREVVDAFFAVVMVMDC
ncbi:DALR anticodon-binding domain-containing protein, partial [Klebsiella pneumoniae]|uniref:DALR anticodon-binding domain-containing protein n=1 Tax=Klebsiella pneumoniae TaxID=573 RepID=UPI00272F9C77